MIGVVKKREQHLIKFRGFFREILPWLESDQKWTPFGWVCARSPRAPRHCLMIRHPPRLESPERSGTPGAPGHKGHLDWASRPWLCRGHNFHSTRILLCAKSALKQRKHCSTAANGTDSQRDDFFFHFKALWSVHSKFSSSILIVLSVEANKRNHGTNQKTVNNNRGLFCLLHNSIKGHWKKDIWGHKKKNLLKQKILWSLCSCWFHAKSGVTNKKKY